MVVPRTFSIELYHRVPPNAQSKYKAGIPAACVACTSCIGYPNHSFSARS